MFTFDSQAEGPISMLSDVDEALGDIHGLRLKTTSKEVIKAECKDKPEYHIIDRHQCPWPVKPQTRILGPIVTANGSPMADVDRALDTIRVVFFQNSKFLTNT